MHRKCLVLCAVVSKTGDVCISILHDPGEDKYGYERPEERWLPIHTVETIMVSVISMLADPNDESPANLDAAVIMLLFVTFVWHQFVVLYCVVRSCLYCLSHSVSLTSQYVSDWLCTISGTAVIFMNRMFQLMLYFVNMVEDCWYVYCVTCWPLLLIISPSWWDIFWNNCCGHVSCTNVWLISILNSFSQIFAKQNVYDHSVSVVLDSVIISIGLLCMSTVVLCLVPC